MMQNRDFRRSVAPPPRGEEFIVPPAWLVIGLAVVVGFGPILAVMLAGWLRHQGGYETLLSALGGL